MDRELVVGRGQEVGKLRLGAIGQVQRVQGQRLNQLGLALDGGQKPEADPRVLCDPEHLELTNQSQGFRSRDLHRPIRGQYYLYAAILMTHQQ